MIKQKIILHVKCVAESENDDISYDLIMERGDMADIRRQCELAAYRAGIGKWIELKNQRGANGH